MVFYETELDRCIRMPVHPLVRTAVADEEVLERSVDWKPGI